MGSIMPWLLVALCFALGVASRSISDTFVMFVPALQQAFDAHRGSVTLGQTTGGGTTVRVTLPTAPVAEAEEHPSATGVPTPGSPVQETGSGRDPQV